MPDTSNDAGPGVPKLLSGGNPQIAKGDGDVPVQAYIEAMPGWKRDVGRQLDALIERAVPKVRKAVRGSSPISGVEGQGWFLRWHGFTRSLHLHEDDVIDEGLLTRWVEQAATIPGWDGFCPGTRGRG